MGVSMWIRLSLKAGSMDGLVSLQYGSDARGRDCQGNPANTPYLYQEQIDKVFSVLGHPRRKPTSELVSGQRSFVVHYFNQGVSVVICLPQIVHVPQDSFIHIGWGRPYCSDRPVTTYCTLSNDILWDAMCTFSKDLEDQIIEITAAWRWSKQSTLYADWNVGRGISFTVFRAKDVTSHLMEKQAKMVTFSCLGELLS